MTNYALIDSNGTIVNRIVIDDIASYSIPDGHRIIEESNTALEIGASFIGDVYIPLPAPSPSAIAGFDIDRERDRRIATLFVFEGVPYQLDADSQRFITAKGAQAKFAILAGVQLNDLRWADPDKDFGWIATDNSVTPMDAQTMAAFADAADLWVTAHIMASHTIKAMDPIPADYAADQYWP